MRAHSFNNATTPRLIFGAGRRSELGKLTAEFGSDAIVVVGNRSLEESGELARIVDNLAASGVKSHVVSLSHEPTPAWIDDTVARMKSEHHSSDCVVAVGGGSVVDAGKAVAAMMCEEHPVTEYLEGVGKRSPSGHRLPFIAVPTTAGTGSEATKNAVLSEPGPNGFKKSLRHDRYVADVALLDPALALSCPRAVTAACGLDAFTQLLESYVSTQATPFTDALALDGIARVSRSLVPACSANSGDVSVRAELAYAAYLSGITLANAGLGVVHGIAGPLGGIYPIPHGVACGALVAAATQETIETLRQLPDGDRGLERYANVGRVVAGPTPHGTPMPCGEACELLVAQLREWRSELEVPGLASYGVAIEDTDAIVERTSCKYNPAPLTDEGIQRILIQSL